ncbi:MULTISPECIES: ferritin [unclassified Pseudactinotalea]|uniref:ferritin n=1 Tax=unclassified Pseudactinotalea TaxID=2649176 RepID=UPI00128BF25B|nr:MULTISPECIES: ferritin [unclassified Pseudactinotalea]MPV48995.1 ferritin [Pseudactinotalea sp. HY160]QGH68328.1 ferritin [Pseudactinotalea sp. HY158]
MKMSAELETLFNAQITLEFEASMVYRQLAIRVSEMDLSGASAWLRHQADEEIVHANKFIDHLDDRGNYPRIGDIAQPPDVRGASMLEIFQAALAHEEKVSAAIRKLALSAEDAGDLDSRPILNWFFSEQIEEESTVREIISRIELAGDDGAGLLKIDEQLGRRPSESTENTEPL